MVDVALKRAQPDVVRSRAWIFCSVVKQSGKALALVVPAPSLKKDGIPSEAKSMTCFQRGLKLSLLWFQ